MESRVNSVGFGTLGRNLLAAVEVSYDGAL